MISEGNKQFQSLWLGNRAIVSVYLGPKLLWQAIRNSILGGWWQGGHCWQYGCGWKQNSKNS